MLRCKQKKAQSTLEYIIVLTAIVGAFIVAAGAIRGKVESALNKAGQTIENAADKISNIVN
jgi:hypothetical protein